MAKMRGILRFIWFVLVITFFIGRFLLYRLFVKDKISLGLKHRARFCRFILWSLGVRVKVKGSMTKGTVMYIGNHRSYLDPIVALKDVLAFPVAKAEVSKWPLIGKGAAETGIIFVSREQRASRVATREAMANSLRQGHSVLIYPEGTTHILPATIDFRLGAFNTAVREKVPVVPMVIHYENIQDAWIGDDTFIRHFVECFGKRRTHITQVYGEPIEAEDGLSLRQFTKDWIDHQMAALAPEPADKLPQGQGQE